MNPVGPRSKSALHLYPRIVVVTGGQTGVDRAALQAAVAAALPVTGYVPAGRRAEDGPLPRSYPFVEGPVARTTWRTLANLRVSDGALILSARGAAGGTALMLTAPGPPKLALDPKNSRAPRLARWFLSRHKIRWLNIGGPRASAGRDIEARAEACLERLFADL